MTTPPRRERLRTATVAEIKDGARHLLVTGGPQAISLRAIARDMGMTAPAIYRYPRSGGVGRRTRRRSLRRVTTARRTSPGHRRRRSTGPAGRDGTDVPRVGDLSPGRVYARLRQPGPRDGGVPGRLPGRRRPAPGSARRSCAPWSSSGTGSRSPLPRPRCCGRPLRRAAPA